MPQIQGDTIKLPVAAVYRSILPHFPRYKPSTVATKHYDSPGGTVHITATASVGIKNPGGTFLIQGVNKLYAKAVVTAGSPAQFNFDIPGTALHQRMFFTQVLPPPVLGQGSGLTFDIQVNGVSRNDLMNAIIREESDTDVFAGGYHGWYVGDFDGRLAFSESMFTSPIRPLFEQRPQLPVCIPSDPLNGTGNGKRFICRGPTAYVAAGEIAPSFSFTGMGKDAQLRAFRLSETANVNVGVGAHVTVASVGGNVEAGIGVGSTKSTLDFIDLNGDRYPDSVSGGVVLYNNGKGEFTPGPDIGIGVLRDTSSRNVRASIGLGANDRGQLLNLMSPKGKVKGVVSTKVGSRVDYGFSSNNVTLEDINGDGLPDRISRNATTGDTMVRLNLGYRFDTSARPWAGARWANASINPFTALASKFGNDVGTEALSVTDTGSNSASIGGGVTGPGGGIGGGVGDVRNTTRTITRLLDINGDGLPDEILEAGRRRHVRQNQQGLAIRGPCELEPGQQVRIDPDSCPNPSTCQNFLPITPPGSFQYPTSFAFLQQAETAGYAIEEGWPSQPQRRGVLVHRLLLRRLGFLQRPGRLVADGLRRHRRRRQTRSRAQDERQPQGVREAEHDGEHGRAGEGHRPARRHHRAVVRTLRQLRRPVPRCGHADEPPGAVEGARRRRPRALLHRHHQL